MSAFKRRGEARGVYRKPLFNTIQMRYRGDGDKMTGIPKPARVNAATSLPPPRALLTCPRFCCIIACGTARSTSLLFFHPPGERGADAQERAGRGARGVVAKTCVLLGLLSPPLLLCLSWSIHYCVLSASPSVLDSRRLLLHFVLAHRTEYGFWS